MVEESKPTKQELLKAKREKNKQIVRATVAYECGACGFHTTRQIEPDADGLIFIADAFCGACCKNMNFRLLSTNISKMEVKTRMEWEEHDSRMITHCAPEPDSKSDPSTELDEEYDEPDAGTKQTSPPEKATCKTKKLRGVDKA